MLYCGTHTSLYNTLPSNAIPILENAILKSRARLYDAAEHVFQQELSAYCQVPVVAIEHAETLLHRYKNYRILEVLGRVPIRDLSRFGEQNDVHRLIALTVGLAKMLTEGIYEPALEEVVRLQNDWASKPVDEYTDIQVNCVRKYYLACTFLGASCNLVTCDMRFIPKPDPKHALPQPWQGLTDLRISLISQSRFMEALRFSSTERSAGTAMDNYQTTCLLLQLTMDHRTKVANTRDEIPWRIAMLGYKLDLGKLFASLGAKPQAEIWFNNLEAEFVECISLMNSTDSTLQASDSLDLLALEFHRLKMVEKEEPTQARLEQLLILADKMQAAGHIETESAHFLAIAWAKKLYPSDEFEIFQTDIQFRSQNLFRTQGRVSSEMTNLVDIMTPVLNSDGGVAKSGSYVEFARRIEALQEFDRRHPYITLPTVKYLHSSMLRKFQIQARQRDDDTISGAMQAASHAFASNLPSGDKLRREVSITTPNEQSLKVKDILDQREVESRYFNMDYKVVVPELLQRLVPKEVASGMLTEQSLIRLFGSGAENTQFKTDQILKMQGKELLHNLVGTPEFPLNAKEWAQRRSTLRSWLLDDSGDDYFLRQCLLIAIHNRRYHAWSEHARIKIAEKGFVKLELPKLVLADCIGKTVRTITPGWFHVNCELINAIQERLNLKEMKLVSSGSKDYFEREWWIVRSMLSRLYLNLFFCCQNPGDKLSNVLVEFLDRADEIARGQVAYWRREENSQLFATEVIYISTIAQFRIEFGITNDSAEIARMVDDTLALLGEVELLFGTTLYEVDLGRTLDFLNMKSYMGSGMGIWQIGKIAIRLLSLVIVQIGNNAQSGLGDEEITTRRQRRLGQLWHWVQRVKARTLAQSMGLDNGIPDSMLVEIQRSLTDERASVEKEIATIASHLGGTELAMLERRLAALNLEVESAPPLEFLSQIRNILKDSSNKVDLDGSSNSIDNLFIEDLRRISTISKLKRPEVSHIEEKANIEQELSQINGRMAARPSLQKLATIADFLNREEVLRNRLEVTSDRLQTRIELQRLRNEMRREPVLERMLRIREGRPVSDQDLHRIAATRGGKVAFVDWITISSFKYNITRVYMLIWRNGICKGVDLGTEHGFQQASVKKFFDVKDLYLPDVSPTPLDEMNLEELAPTAPKEFQDDDLKPVLSCFELVKPLFNDSLIEQGDLLVLSLTEGFQNFPLHAIQEDEDGEVGPLILKHPVVYVPSLSVLHKCFWSRQALSLGHDSSKDEKLRALVIGGIVSPKPVFQYGTKAVGKIGDILMSPETTFIGKDATLHNFSTHISNSDVLHIHLHTNYGVENSSKRSEHGHLRQEDAEDVAFVNSPLDQAIVFNGADSKNKLTTARIIELELSKGAHCNLMACASGRQGTYHAALREAKPTEDVITNEVMGLVPGFLFSGAGSVTSTLWPIMDEHGAVFSNYFFREFMEARRKARSQLLSGKIDLSWIDLAEIHQKAVLEMRRIYKQPSAWAGFVLSGCWKFQI